MSYRKWLSAVINSFFHWVAFSIIASFIPFMVFVELTKEDLFSGTSRIINEAILKGDIALLMIPLVGGLIGETVIRSFYNKSIEIFSAIVGVCLFALLVSYSNEFRSLDYLTLTKEETAAIYNSTTLLFCFMVMYALSIMALSSAYRE